jgi:hypothetical protein
MPHRLASVTAIGEGSGWVGASTAVLAFAGATGKLLGLIEPTSLQPWLLLIASAVMGGASVWAAVYHRIIKAQLDSQLLTAIYAANIAAITAGKPAPYPAFLPPMPVVTASTPQAELGKL